MENYELILLLTGQFEFEFFTNLKACTRDKIKDANKEYVLKIVLILQDFDLCTRANLCL